MWLAGDDAYLLATAIVDAYVIEAGVCQHVAFFFGRLYGHALYTVGPESVVGVACLVADHEQASVF